MGFTFNLGIEPEFSIVQHDSEAKPAPITRTKFKGPNACYDVTLASESNALLQPRADYITELADHFTAGLLNHLRAIKALACPTYNSYQDLLAQGDLAEFSWAPTLAVWGKNDRSAMLRLPLNRWCLENSAVDMSCNPYLCAALHFEAGLEGVEN